MDVGTELRKARQAAGLSLEQISDTTKIQVAKLEALEANAYDQLPHGIYLEGIVRAYASEVGVDADQFVDALDAELTIRPTRHIDATATYDLDTFAPEVGVESEPPLATAPAAATQLATAPVAMEALPASARAEHAVAQPRGALRRRALSAALAVLALSASFGLGWYLYKTSRPFPDAQRAAVPAVSSDAVRAGAADDTRANDSSDRKPADDAGADLVAASDSAVPDMRASQTPDETGAAAAAASDARAGSAAASSDAPAKSATAAPEDFAGIWRLDTEVLSSSVGSFKGLQLGYHLQLDQQGTQISGNGEKISENGRALTAAARTAIVVRGEVDGNQLALTFIERGTRRSTQGALVLRRDDDGTLRGRFSSNAAQSSGLAQLRRPQG